MNIKFLFSFVLGVLFASSFAFAECSFTSRDSTCEVFSDTFNKFDLSFTDEKDLSEFSVSLYQKGNPQNKIRLDVDYTNNVVRNVMPFTEVGVYIFEVRFFNKAGVDDTFRKEFIFDNLVPNQPIIPINLDSRNSRFNVLGNSNFVKTVVAVDLDGNEIGRVDVLSDGSFNLPLDLNSGLNFVRFYSVGFNGLNSDFVERVILIGADVVTNLNPQVSDINLNNNDLINGVFDKFTSKRNFYVSGSNGVSYSRVYISGSPVSTDLNGNFGGFVNLNEGKNKIEVLSGDVLKSIEVNFIEPKFHFTKLDFPKVIGDKIINFKVETDLDLEFLVYLNGKFVKEIKPVDLFSEFSLENLNEGRNFVTLKGYGGEQVSEVIYYDSSLPVISNLVPSEMDSNLLVFKIEDNFGLDVSKTKLTLDGKLVDNDFLDIVGDYYFFDVGDVLSGSHSYSLEVFDVVGNLGSSSGNFNKVVEGLPVLSSFEINKGKRIGSDLFFASKGNVVLNIKPSENIAFSKILMDGEDQTNYNILRDNLVILNLNVREDQGAINFCFINKDLNEFCENYEYRVLNDVEFKIDYVERPVLKKGSVFRVLGSVESSTFNWDKFEINGVAPKRFGKFFESYVEFENLDNLKFVGEDLFSQSFFKSYNYLKLDTLDNRFKFNFDNDLTNGLGILGTHSLEDSNSILNFVNYYDGVSQRQVIGSNSGFSLASAQRSGVRSINLKGERASGSEFYDVSKVSYDGMKPQVVFLPGKTLVFSRISDIKEFKVNDEVKFLSSECSEKYLGEFCYYFSSLNSNDEVFVKDEFGNVFERTFNGVSFDSLEKPNVDLDLFFTGNDLSTDLEIFFVSGQIVSNSGVKSVKVDSRNCDFDDFNFLCQVSVLDGLNEFDISVINFDGDKLNKKFSIIGTGNLSRTNLVLKQISGDDIFSVVGTNYLVGDIFNLVGEVSKEVLIKLVINGEESLVGVYNSSFSLNDINLSSHILGIDEKEFVVGLKSVDEFGNEINSNSVKILFYRVLNTIVDIFVG